MNKRPIIIIVILGIIIGLLIIVTPQGRTGIKTVLFVTEIVPAFPLKLQSLVTGEPVKSEIVYYFDQTQGIADLYKPSGSGEYSAVLLFLGVNPAGRDDPRVVGLANSLARSGMIVMIPWSQEMAQKNIDQTAIPNLISAFKALKNLEGVDQNRIGVAGFCVGASLITAAAANPEISNDVRFINFFGGYYNALDLIVSISSGKSFYGQTIQSWEPDQLTKEVFTNELINTVSDDSDQHILKNMFLPDKIIQDEYKILNSNEAKIVYELLNAPELERAKELVKQLPISSKNQLELISPSSYIDDINADVLIMQNREDNLIPVEESRRLAKALSLKTQISYTEFSIFEHIEPTKPMDMIPFLNESFKLIKHMYKILRYTS